MPDEKIDVSENGELRSKPQRRKKAIFRELLPYFLILLGVLLFRIFILINATIPTESMENTIMRQTRVIGLKCTYWFSEPQRGDIIVFKAPDDPATPYVKRIIGMPGDTVQIISGVTYINGVIYQESYLAEPMKGSFGPYVVPEGCYFMMGDNRNYSLDSRYWTNTFLKKADIYGKVFFSYWPKLRWIK